MKLYDFDGMFDEKLSDYISKNTGKYREEQWEDLIPKLYKQFGDTFIKSVGDTPNGFYAKMDENELVSALVTHLKRGVPVSEFLCNAIEKRVDKSLLFPLLHGSEDEREYAINLIGAQDSALPVYMDMLADPSTGEDIKNRCADFIKQKADLALEKALANYAAGVEKEYMLEIMSRSVVRDDRVFEILVKELRTDPENVPMHASYLAAYGDERALPVLLDKIEEEGISFIEYQELKFAIEALGGEYDKERDFSDDEYFKAVKSQKLPFDLFSGFANKK